MPSTRIATGTWAIGREREVLEAVQSALVEGLRIPAWDRDVTLDLYGPDRRLVPDGRSDRYTVVEVKLFAGRTIEAKRALYKAMVNRLVSLGVPGEEINIVLVEVARENWGLRGGIPASDVDLGYKVDV